MPQKQRYESLGIDLEEVKAELLAVNNFALENKLEDMRWLHHISAVVITILHSLVKGPYNSVADYVFAKENVDALYSNMMMKDLEDLRLSQVSEDKRLY